MKLSREQIEKWKAHFQNEADHWEAPELKKAFLERVAICDMALALRRDAEDAARYRFLKSRLTVPGAMYRFLRENDWSLDTDLRDIDGAIDKARRDGGSHE